MSLSDGLENLRCSAVEFARRLWSWSGLNAAFKRATGRNIRMGDIDGFVEINNHFLFVEGKPPRASLDNGQGRALSRLNKLPGVTVVIVEGDPPDHVVGWYVIDSGHTYTGNYSDFSEWVFTYASYADNDWRMN